MIEQDADPVSDGAHPSVAQLVTAQLVRCIEGEEKGYNIFGKIPFGFGRSFGKIDKTKAKIC